MRKYSFKKNIKRIVLSDVKFEMSFLKIHVFLILERKERKR